MKSHSKLSKQLLVLALALVFFAGLAGARQIPENDPIELDLKKAPLGQVLQSFAVITGSELDMESGIEGAVSLAMTAPWSEVLGQICRDHDLFCEVLSGEPPVLRVGRAGPTLPAGYADPIDMSLKNADLRELLVSFGAISGRSLTLPDELAGSVTINIERVPWTRLLAELSRLNGYRLMLGEESIELAPSDEKPELVNMSLKSADAREILETFTQIPAFFGFENVALEFDEELEGGGVTVELKMVNYLQTLEILCDQLGCDWGLRYGDPVVLWVKRSEDAAVVEAAELDVPADRIPAIRKSGAAEPKALAFRFVPLAAPAIEGNVQFSWASPVQVLAPSPGLQAVLTWVPFDPQLSVILPMVRRCGARGSSIKLLDPIVLPLAERRLFDVDGARLELRGERTFDSYRPKTQAERCSAGELEPFGVEVRRVDAEGTVPQPTRGFPVRQYVLVTPIGTTRPAAAVLDLGLDGEGRRSVALVRPDEDRTGVVVERQVLPDDGSRQEILTADGKRFELVLRFWERPPKAKDEG